MDEFQFQRVCSVKSVNVSKSQLVLCEISNSNIQYANKCLKKRRSKIPQLQKLNSKEFLFKKRLEVIQPILFNGKYFQKDKKDLKTSVAPSDEKKGDVRQNKKKIRNVRTYCYMQISQNDANTQVSEWQLCQKQFHLVLMYIWKLFLIKYLKTLLKNIKMKKQLKRSSYGTFTVFSTDVVFLKDKNDTSHICKLNPNEATNKNTVNNNDKQENRPVKVLPLSELRISFNMKPGNTKQKTSIQKVEPKISSDDKNDIPILVKPAKTKSSPDCTAEGNCDEVCDTIANDECNELYCDCPTPPKSYLKKTVLKVFGAKFLPKFKCVKKVYSCDSIEHKPNYQLKESFLRPLHDEDDHLQQNIEKYDFPKTVTYIPNDPKPLCKDLSNSTKKNTLKKEQKEISLLDEKEATNEVKGPTSKLLKETTEIEYDKKLVELENYANIKYEILTGPSVESPEKVKKEEIKKAEVGKQLEKKIKTNTKSKENSSTRKVISKHDLQVQTPACKCITEDKLKEIISEVCKELIQNIMVSSYQSMDKTQPNSNIPSLNMLQMKIKEQKHKIKETLTLNVQTNDCYPILIQQNYHMQQIKNEVKLTTTKYHSILEVHPKILKVQKKSQKYQYMIQNWPAIVMIPEMTLENIKKKFKITKFESIFNIASKPNKLPKDSLSTLFLCKTENLAETICEDTFSYETLHLESTSDSFPVFTKEISLIAPLEYPEKDFSNSSVAPLHKFINKNTYSKADVDKPQETAINSNMIKAHVDSVMYTQNRFMQFISVPSKINHRRLSRRFEAPELDLPCTQIKKDVKQLLSPSITSSFKLTSDVPKSLTNDQNNVPKGKSDSEISESIVIDVTKSQTIYLPLQASRKEKMPKKDFQVKNNNPKSIKWNLHLCLPE